MPGYRTAIVHTELVTRYPVGDDANILTEAITTVSLVALDPSDLDVVAEKIDHGRKTRRFGITRAKLRYRQVVAGDHHNDMEDFVLRATVTDWEKQGVSAHGKSVRVDGTTGTADGYYHWSPSWGRDVPMPDALARAVTALDAWFEIPVGAR